MIRFGYFNKAKSKKLSVPSKEALRILTDYITEASQSGWEVLCLDAYLLSPINLSGNSIAMLSDLGKHIKKNNMRLFVYAKDQPIAKIQKCANILDQMRLDNTHKIIVRLLTASGLRRTGAMTNRLCIFTSKPNLFDYKLPVIANIIDKKYDSSRISAAEKTWMKKHGNQCIMFTASAFGKHKKKYKYWVDFKAVEELYKNIMDKNIDVILYAEEKDQANQETKD